MVISLEFLTEKKSILFLPEFVQLTIKKDLSMFIVVGTPRFFIIQRTTEV